MTLPYIPSGYIHTPVTPFTPDDKINYRLLERLIEFHIGQGAQAICAPAHIGESPSLTEEEQRQLIRAVITTVSSRLPVIAHISRPGTKLTVDAARDAQQAGAAAIMMSPPYYWTPPAHMQLEHFSQVAKSVDIPMLAYNAPSEMSGVALTTDFVTKLIERSPNFIGMVDLSLDWQFQIEMIPLAKKLRPAFTLISGSEYMVSMQAIGGSGSLTALSAIAPNLVRNLFGLCALERYVDARQTQFKVAELRQLLKPWPVRALKAAMEMMGRSVGDTRPPVMPLAIDEKRKLWGDLERSKILDSEPRGWV